MDEAKKKKKQKKKQKKRPAPDAEDDTQVRVVVVGLLLPPPPPLPRPLPLLLPILLAVLRTEVMVSLAGRRLLLLTLGRGPYSHPLGCSYGYSRLSWTWWSCWWRMLVMLLLSLCWVVDRGVRCPGGQAQEDTVSWSETASGPR
jgi:hypothetical protein